MDSHWRIVCLVAASFCVHGSVSAQWITFNEEPARLVSTSPNLASSGQDEMDMAVGDLDKDGDTDLIIVRKIPFSSVGARQHVLLMNESGSLVNRTSSLCPDFLTNLSNARDVAIVDVDVDTWPDVVIVNTFDEQPELYMNMGEQGGGWLGLQKSTSRFPFVGSGSFLPKFCGVGFGDITGNGAPDLYFTDYSNFLEDRLLINDGTGNFTDETGTRLAPGMAQSGFGTGAVIRDCNGDGLADIVKGESGVLELLINDATNPGHFSVLQTLPEVAHYMFGVADLDLDGDQDFYVVQDPQDRYIINEGTNANGTIITSFTTLTTSPATSGFGGNVTFGDLDDDGRPDVVVSDVDVDIPGCTRRSAFLRNLGVGSWDMLADPWNTQQPWSTNGTYDCAVLDIDGDGRNDVVAGTCGGLRIFMGVPQLSLDLTPQNPNSIDVRIRHATPNAQGFTLLSATPVVPGTGPVFGLSTDAAVLFGHLAPQPPFVAAIDGFGEFDWGLTLLAPLGVSIQGLAVTVDGASNVEFSPITTTTW